MLIIPKRKVVKTMHIGITSVFQFDIYEDGTSSQPKVTKSYNFIPGAAKKKKPVNTPKVILMDEEEEVY